MRLGTDKRKQFSIMQDFIKANNVEKSTYSFLGNMKVLVVYVLVLK